jgi:DNA repair photolyase
MSQLQLSKGKAEFIKRQKPDGTIEDICICEDNADFSFACIGQVHGSLLDEVIRNNGCYDKDKICQHRQTVGIDQRCEYCYAKRKNWGKVIPKEIGKKTRQQFEEEKPKIIRLGKNTECGHFFYHKQLIQFLELCKEYGTSIIFPTKMLSFEKEIANLLQSTNSVVNYSICNDSFEIGAVSQGFSNEWRIEQAKRYQNEGVNTTSTLTCDITNSLEENLKYGFAIKEILSAKEQGLTLRLLPLRLNSKKICLKATGKKWEDIVMPKIWKDTLDFEFEWLYEKKRNNEAIPLFFHHDFKELTLSGIGICGKVGKMEYCDKCNLEKETRICFHEREIPQREKYANKLTYKRYNNKKEEVKTNQLSLF